MTIATYETALCKRKQGDGTAWRDRAGGRGRRGRAVGAASVGGALSECENENENAPASETSEFQYMKEGRRPAVPIVHCKPAMRCVVSLTSRTIFYILHINTP